MSCINTWCNSDLFFNAKWTTFKNKLHLNEIMMMSTLDKINMLSWIFFIVLAQ